MYYVAASLLVLVGLAHSYLGERYILQRLFARNNLPKLFGGTSFTQNTLRFAWHVTTVAWFGFAAILVHLARPGEDESVITVIIAVTFSIHFLIALIASKGKHLSWIVFLLIALFSAFATRL